MHKQLLKADKKHNRKEVIVMYEGNNWENVNGTGTENNTYSYEKKEERVQQPEKQKKSSMGAGRKIALGICCGLLFGVFAGVGFEAVTTASNFLKEGKEALFVLQTKEPENGVKEKAAEEAKTSISVAETDLKETVPGHTTAMDVSDIVKSVMPAMVSVNKKYIQTTTFWGQDFSNEGASAGSGIIVGKNDNELLLVTNYHVVSEAEELTVQFADGSQAKAKEKGVKPEKDLAVIAVPLSDISSETMSRIAVAKLGDSTALEVGEPVIAIGNSMGYGQSVSAGVVSALDRPIGVQDTSAQKGDKEVNTFIQTDAAINPGNSGGALLNVNGEVVGINSNKLGGAIVEGMGYAIPISSAKPIIEDLMTKETRYEVTEAERGYLGITGIDVVAEYAEVYGMPQGVYISSVNEGTGAADAGLIRGDIITGLNGVEIQSMEELKSELAYYAAGTSVELTIMQGSPVGYQAKTVSVVLGKQSSTQ